MHSRIYNLTDRELNQDALYEELESWNNLADYVILQSNEDIKDDIEWIGECFNLEYTDTTINFSKEAADKYWENKFKKVKEIVENEGITFENRYQIVDELEDVHGMYVVSEEGVLPLSEFMQHIARGYIEPRIATVKQTFDYHF